MIKKKYVRPQARMRGDTKLLIVAAIHKGCPSTTSRFKKG